MGNLENKKKEVIMEATFKAVLMTGETLEPYFSGEKGYADIGGFEVRVPGYKEPIPFDFEATARACNDDGTYTFGNWDGFLERIYDVDPCHEDDWAENGLKKEDITARLLASADYLEEFYFNVCNMNDREIPCFLEVLKMDFWDEQEKGYSITPEVLKEYNRLRVAEQLAELMMPKTSYLERKPFFMDYINRMKDKSPADVLDLIDSIQGSSFYNTKARALADFLIDCIIEVSSSKKDIYRVGLVACGNPDYGENPYERLPETDAKYVYKESIEKCQKAVVSYIDKHDLGSGHWAGGLVFQGGCYVGNVSYNGRFWDKMSEYGSLKTLKKTDLPKWDADICSYGKNLFYEDIMAKTVKRQATKKKDKGNKEMER